jgi:hypothetical protein
MSTPWLYDAVTLRHFGAIRRFDVLAARCKYTDPPRWTREVADEILRAADIGQPGCHVIVSADWLGAPIEPDNADLKGIYRIQVGLNEGRQPPTKHGGEAEGIYFAGKLDGHFVTDDNGAYDFAARRLGPGRVHDTVDLLREAVGFGEMVHEEVRDIANEVRISGRHLRRVHPDPFPRGYFTH